MHRSTPPSILLFLFFSLTAQITLATEQQTIDSLKQALAEQKVRGEAIHATLYELGVEYYYEGAYSQAFENLEKALLELETSQDALWSAKILHRLGQAYLATDQYVLAIEHFLESAEFNEELERFDALATNYNQISLAFIRQRDYEQAIQFTRQAISVLSDKSDYKKVLAQTLNNLGLHFNNLGTYDSAIYYHKKAGAIYDSLGFPGEKGKAYNNVSNSYREKKDFKKALEYSLEALKLKEAAGNHLSQVFSLLLLADIYNDMNQPLKAIEFAERGLELSETHQFADRKRVALLRLSVSYELVRNYQQAHIYHKQYTLMQDSIFDQRRYRQIAALTKRYDLEKKEQQLALQASQLENQEAKIKQQRTVTLSLLAIGVLLLAITSMLILLIWSKNQRNRVISKQNIQLNELNKTKDKFFGIIAHDIRGPIIALQSVASQISFYLKKQNTEKLIDVAQQVSDTSSRLNDLLDNLLSWALLQMENVPYNPDAVNLKAVTEENLRLFHGMASNKNINLTSDIENDLFVIADEKALHAILRNLISNAIKFTKPGGNISVDAEIGNKAFVKINDTGTGMPSEKLADLFTIGNKSDVGTDGEKGTGLGLVLCKELVELNHGKIEVNSTVGKGSKFTFDLPLAAA